MSTAQAERLHELCEKTDVFCRESVNVKIFNDGRTVERSTPESVVDDIVPHLEDHAETENALLAQVLQGVILGNVEKRGSSHSATTHVVPGEISLGDHREGNNES